MSGWITACWPPPAFLKVRSPLFVASSSSQPSTAKEIPVSRWSGLSGIPPRRTPPFCGAPPPPPPEEAELPDEQPAAAVARASAATTRGMRRMTLTSRGPAARVEPQVGEIRERVEDDDEERPVQGQCHQRRQVEVRNRLLCVLAHPLESEDRLDQDDRAAHGGAEIEPEQRDHRNQAGAQGVACEHPRR